MKHFPFLNTMQTAPADAPDHVSQIVHDLRTPLNAIIGFAEMMERATLGPIGNKQYEAYIRHIRESGDELLQAVDRLIGPEPKQKSKRTKIKEPA